MQYEAEYQTFDGDKSYFNIRGGSTDGQRIAGNPATDLYAGFNRTSDYGNLERAGNKRLETRQKTIERKGYKGKALEQLTAWAKNNSHIHKLIALKHKWGLDFSIDYCDREGNVFEVLHWEFDGFDYNEIADKKIVMDEFLTQQDWNHSAQQILKHKEQWHHLGFF